MKLNDWQKAILKDYADGDFAHLIEAGDIYDPLKLGDTLLSFMLIELSDKEDCESVDMAIERLSTAHRDLGVALAACVALQGAINKKLDTGEKLFN